MIKANNTHLKHTESRYSIVRGDPNVKESECYLLHFDDLKTPNRGEASEGAILYSQTKCPLYASEGGVAV